MDTKLQQARKYEEVYGDRILERDRPLFHVVPRVGWMNDPNGFSVYKGEYHLFYQYYPYNTIWGPMHWGHVKTKDLVRWEWLPAAIAPDEEYDNAGCFSGSTVEMPDGRQLLMYTGVKERQREDGYIESRQMQCVAFGDGIDYEKYENNPVLTSADLPEGSVLPQGNRHILGRAPHQLHQDIAVDSEGHIRHFFAGPCRRCHR